MDRWFCFGILNSFGCCGWKHGFSDSGVCKASGKGSLLRNDHQTPDHFLPNIKNPPKIHGKISAQGNQKSLVSLMQKISQHQSLLVKRQQPRGSLDGTGGDTRAPSFVWLRWIRCGCLLWDLGSGRCHPLGSSTWSTHCWYLWSWCWWHDSMYLGGG